MLKKLEVYSKRVHFFSFSSNDLVGIGIDTWKGSAAQNIAFRTVANVGFNIALQGHSVASSYGTSYDNIAVVDRNGKLRYVSSSGASSGINSAKSVIDNYINNFSDLNNLTKESITVFPNPAVDMLNIAGVNGDELNFEVYSLTGQVVLAGNLEFSKQINLAQLQNGTYVLRLYNDNINQKHSFIRVKE